MAANKFATMLHRNTNKITVILVYAILEWILIILLLLNSLFSYLIVKFADYFGLKRPCLWCSRLDHIFEPTKCQTSYRSLVCDAHAMEISKLGYCSNHRKLAESQDMCEDCSSSSKSDFLKKFAFFPWMNQLGVAQDKVSENGEAFLKCSCCGVSLDTKFYCSDYYQYLIKPSWEDSEYTQKGNLILESHIDEKVNENDNSDRIGSGFVSDQCDEEQRIDGNREILGENRELETEVSQICPVSSFVNKEMVVDDIDKFHMEIEKKQELVKKDDLNVSMVNESFCDQNPFVEVDCSKDVPSEIRTKHLDFYIDRDDCHLIPIDLIEPIPMEREISSRHEKGEEENRDNEDFVLEFNENFGTQYELVVEDEDSYEEEVPLLSVLESEEEPKVAMLEPRALAKDEISTGMHADENLVMGEGNLVDEDLGQVSIAQTTQTPSISHDVREYSVADGFQESSVTNNVQEGWVTVDDIQEGSVTADDIKDGSVTADDIKEGSVTADDIKEGSVTADDIKEGLVTAGQERDSDNVQAVLEEVHQLESDEIEAEISIGTEIPDQEPIDDLQTQEVPHYICTGEDPSTSNDNHHAYDDYGSKQAEDDELEFRTIGVEESEPVINNHLSLCSESNEIEEDKVPDTPTSIDSLHHLHKKLLFLERRESCTDDSLDGSIISDIEAGDGILTIEKLKSVLRANRKALNALYGELEEERSASAVAASQTMAMINRLQEEKAAMQMEALQYQRMMEEQAEYDQEALQLLNELMIKREKEKAELEKELELYRKKIQDYELKEKIAILNRRKDGGIRSGTSSASCSNAEDSDGLSVDLNHEGKEEGNSGIHQDSSNQNTPADAVLYLEESLASFEEERLSILEQLKVLEEKLFTLSDEEELHFEDIKPIEHLHEENGNGYNENFDYSSEMNGVANGHYKEMNGKHHQERKIIGAKAKRLLPLFDAADAEIEDGMLNGHAEEFDSVTFQKSPNECGIDSKRLAIEEEVDHVYERLQALEADREFLRHCITSLRKGDKGIELLQEILHHLRDLRSVELRARNMGDGAL